MDGRKGFRKSLCILVESHVILFYFYLFIYFLIQVHYFKCLLSDYYVPNTVVNARNTAVKECNSYLHGPYYLVM